MQRVTENPNYDSERHKDELKKQQEIEHRKKQEEMHDRAIVKRYLDIVQRQLDNMVIPKSKRKIFKPKYINKIIVIGRERQGTHAFYHNDHSKHMMLLAERIREKTGWEVSTFNNTFHYDYNGEYGIIIKLPLSEFED